MWVSRENVKAFGPESRDEHFGITGVADDSRVEQASRGGPDAFSVVRVDASAGEDHRAGAGGIRGPQHGPGVARILDADQHGDQSGSPGQDRFERDVEKGADRDQALRRYRLRQTRDRSVGNGRNRDGPLLCCDDEILVATEGGGGAVNGFRRPWPFTLKGLADGLWTFGEESALVVAT